MKKLKCDLCGKIVGKRIIFNKQGLCFSCYLAKALELARKNHLPYSSVEADPLELLKGGGE